MRGTNLGELEELILLVVAHLFKEAYGLNIKDVLQRKSQRSVSLSTVHATLQRLKQKGYLSSEYDDSSVTERGGRPRLIFRVTKSGKEALVRARDLRNDLWDSIPELAFK